MSRYCEKCGSDDLKMVKVPIPAGGYWRKTCLSCGSTGPFMAQPVTLVPARLSGPTTERERA